MLYIINKQPAEKGTNSRTSRDNKQLQFISYIVSYIRRRDMFMNL